MKQPELGTQLIQLRKEKNLTQEELVEVCNVSVRTIQRIESGEVTPRVSTIKVILGALGEDYISFNRRSSQKTKDVELEKTSNWINVAWIAGVIYFVAGSIEAILDYLRFELGEQDISFIVYISAKMVTYFSFTLFIAGFSRLGSFFKNSILEIAGYLFILVTGAVVATDIWTLFLPVSNEISLMIVAIEAIAIGGAGIVFGFGLLKLQDGVGRLALVSGILEIIIGSCLVTVILFFLGIILFIPATVIEIILLFKAAEYLKSEGNQST